MLPACSSPSREPGVLVLRLEADPTTLDPAHIVDVDSGRLAAHLFQTLVRYDKDLRLVGDLAQSWTVSPDGRTYTFALHRGMYFHHGREVTAQDVAASLERVLDPHTRSPNTWILEGLEGAQAFQEGRVPHVSGIRVLDRYHIQLRLREPYAPFLGLLAMPPASVIPPEVIQRLGPAFGSHPVGSGPWRLAAWNRGQDLWLRPHTQFPGPAPDLRGIHYRIIPETLTAVVLFETGELDLLRLTPETYRRYARDPRWRPQILETPGLNTYYLGFNCTRPPFHDARVRRAVHLAIHRARILRTLYEGRGVLARGPVPPTLLPPLPRDPYPYDPDRARRLLQEAGYPAGFSATLLLPAQKEVVDIGEVIQQDLAQVGIRIRLQTLEWSAFKAALQEGAADLFYLSWWADYPDPENFLYPVFHSAQRGVGGNRTGFSDPVFDRWIEAARRTLAASLRRARYRAAQHRVVALAPWVFLWHRKEMAVVRPEVVGFRLFPLYTLDRGLGIRLLKP